MLLSSCGTGSLTGEVGDGTSGGGGYVIPGGDIAGDWDIQVVDDNGNVGMLNELRFNGQGQPSIAYFVVSGTVYWIRYAAYDGWTWEIDTVHETDTMTGCGLTMDPTGRPVLAYVGGDRTPLYYWPFQSDLLMASWTGADWAIEAADEEGVVGLWPSVGFDRFGLAGDQLSGSRHRDRLQRLPSEGPEVCLFHGWKLGDRDGGPRRGRLLHESSVR